MSNYALLHIAKRALGLDDHTYRAVIERMTGKQSAKTLTETERERVIDELKKLGFNPSSVGRRKALEGKFAKKLQALWIAGWNLGIVRNRDDKALLAFVKRQTGLEHTRFLHHAEDGAKAIEALKRWLARDGGVDWTQRRHEAAHRETSGFKIALAQHQRLFPAADFSGFVGKAKDISGKAPHFMTDEADWQPVMNEFGRQIRAAKANRS
ncbi:regulatory protein GemA [Oricola sp.]|uniref:regulatory protein GemA n=1 Tax=Oricola sp. TaxID=1979950 RepID=UPI0025F45C2B|nr:regulatory protein GemA [Oricola sp.]MCI5075573.1 regulatory protein GemA [Oricola sp.]